MKVRLRETERKSWATDSLIYIYIYTLIGEHARKVTPRLHATAYKAL